MNLNDNDRKAYHFAELVRKTSIRIAGLASAGQNIKAAELAVTLSDQAVLRKKEIVGELEPGEDQRQEEES